MTTIRRAARPMATIWKAAFRSAQMVSPYEAFSTLQPATMSPWSVRIAAPTRNLL